MSLKGFAVISVILSCLAVYIIEYHGDGSYSFIQKYPILKTMVLHVHTYVQNGKKYFDIATSLHSSSKSGSSEPHKEKIFTVDELGRYNGEEGSPGLYLAIFGRVFDVEKGRKHYGPGGSYHVFAGRDASKSFITGDFNEAGASDDISDLSPQELKSLQDWAKFYHKEYVYRGKLAGRYYTETGERTDYSKEIEKLFKVAAEESKSSNAELLKYPPCNLEWLPETGTKVWCSKKSGGIQRDWVGVPRKLFKPGYDSFRCTCVPYDGKEIHAGNLELYRNCAPDAVTCYAPEYD